MIEPICFIAGFIVGISLWFYNDIKFNPYRKGYADGYADGYEEAFRYIKEELEKRRAE